jgi:hypothetical protein
MDDVPPAPGGVLPLQQIDASVLSTALLQSPGADRCRRYLGKVGVRYRGAVSRLSLGSLSSQLLHEPEVSVLLFGRLSQMLKVAEIEINCPDLYSCLMVAGLAEIEPKLHTAEALDLAVAATRGALAYVTLNRALLGHRDLQRELGVKMMSPRQL